MRRLFAPSLKYTWSAVSSDNALHIASMTRLALVLAALSPAVAWHQPPARISRASAYAWPHVARAVSMKTDAKPAARALSEGSICEFDDGKGRPMLGLVQSAKPSSTKGVVYHLIDADERLHIVNAKAIHVAFPPNNKVKSTKPADLLNEFLRVAECKPAELGIDVSLLGLAWEMCAQEDVPAHTTAAIFDKIDPALLDGSVPKYRAYRLLTSDIGNIFFRVLHAHDHEHREYKAKTADAVANAKQSWCHAVEALGTAAVAEEFCFA